MSMMLTLMSDLQAMGALAYPGLNSFCLFLRDFQVVNSAGEGEK
jgi:hypothetical protein